MPRNEAQDITLDQAQPLADLADPAVTPSPAAPLIGQTAVVQVIKRATSSIAEHSAADQAGLDGRAAHSASEDPIQTLLQQGDAYRQAQELQKAQDCYQQVLKLDPDHTQARWNLAIALELQGERKPAINHYFRALSQDPTRLQVPDLCRFGDILQQEHQLSRALSCYRWALQQHDQAGIHMRIAQVLFAQERYEKAAASYQRSIDQTPTWQGYHCLGDTFLKLKQWRRAVAAYRQAIQLNPDFVWSHHNLAEALSRLQRWEPAAKAYQRAIRIDPQICSTYSGWGELCVRQGKLEQAALLFRQGLQLRGWDSPLAREYTFTHDWFAHNIPALATHLQDYVDSKVNVLEIGSFEGMSTCWFLEHILTHPQAKLTCIDTCYSEHFDPNVQKTGVSEKINKIVGNSHEVLARLTPESYDVIYIDGCHWAEHVRIDGVLSWKLIKPGGLVIFDDYHWSDPNKPGEDTQIGIDAFLATVQSEFDFVYQGYQLFIRKRVSPPDPASA